jgi:beta-glucanase (GH16 family)
MRYYFLTIVAILSFHVCASCKKEEGARDVAPSNIVINAVISSDGSGNVDFTVTANNANTYTYEFGNGDSKIVPNGVTSYQYTSPGTLTYNVKVTARNATGLSASAVKPITVTVAATTPTLAWSDEFDRAGAPDPAKWGYDIGTGANGWGNNELQHYTNRAANAYVDNGTLKIKAIKENFSGSAYTSARLLTKGKYEFKYGRVEMRAKLPAGAGTWPAFWMLGADISTVGWPACGEIDIMEHKGSDPNRISAALHFPGNSGANPVVNTTLITNAITEFHVYKVEWSATSIQFFVDDKLYHSMANRSNVPFNKDFFILLNLAMGGGFGGPVDPAFTSAIYEIDYVRVYR